MRTMGKGRDAKYKKERGMRTMGRKRDLLKGEEGDANEGGMGTMKGGGG